jgi:hypothetical protein
MRSTSGRSRSPSSEQVDPSLSLNPRFRGDDEGERARWPVFQRGYNGAQPGDPVKAAAAIIHIAKLDEPPLRLILGSDAFRIIEQTDQARSEADKKWRGLSLSTDFEARE